MTQVLYACDGEQSAIIDLDTLIGNFTSYEEEGSRYKFYADDVRHDLRTRGWYEGLHDSGRYLILNIDRFSDLVRPAAYWR